MGQSMGSVGNRHKQAGARGQKKNQPEAKPGQKMSDQSPRGRKTKPEGGAEQGPRSIR